MSPGRLQKVRVLAGALCLVFWTVGAEPGVGQAPIRAKVVVDGKDGESNVFLHGIDKDSVSLSAAGGSGIAKVPVSRFQKIQFVYGEEVSAARTAFAEERYAEVIKLLEPGIARVMPYRSLPEHNIASVSDPYVAALQLENRIEALRVYYKLVKRFGLPPERETAQAWIWYLDAREGRTEGILEQFESLGTLSQDTEAFLLRQLSACRVHLASGAFRNAADAAAIVSAVTEIQHVLHPEALFLSAQCYDGLARAVLEGLRLERERELERALLNERVKVARELEAKADAEKRPEPTEEEILSAIDRAAVEASLPDLPAVSELKLAKVAQRLYRLVERIFPETTWGEQAAEQVTEEAPQK